MKPIEVNKWLVALWSRFSPETIAQKIALKDPLGELSVFLSKHGSDCVTLYTMALDDRDKGAESFRRDLYQYLKEVRMSALSLGRDSFLQYALKRLPVPDNRADAGEGKGVFRKLSPELQIVSWLRDGMGLRYAEIARVTGLPIKDVTSKIQEARRVMGEALSAA